MFRYEELRPLNINLKKMTQLSRKKVFFVPIFFFLPFLFFCKQLLKKSFLIFHRPLFKNEVLKMKNKFRQSYVCMHFRLLGLVSKAIFH